MLWRERLMWICQATGHTESGLTARHHILSDRTECVHRPQRFILNGMLIRSRHDARRHHPCIHFSNPMLRCIVSQQREIKFSQGHPRPRFRKESVPSYDSKSNGRTCCLCSSSALSTHAKVGHRLAAATAIGPLLPALHCRT